MELPPYLKEESTLVVDGKAFRVWRRHYEITQSAIAKRAKLSTGFVNLVESGKKRAAGKTAERMEKALDYWIGKKRSSIPNE